MVYRGRRLSLIEVIFHAAVLVAATDGGIKVGRSLMDVTVPRFSSTCATASTMGGSVITAGSLGTLQRRPQSLPAAHRLASWVAAPFPSSAASRVACLPVAPTSTFERCLILTTSFTATVEAHLPTRSSTSMYMASGALSQSVKTAVAMGLSGGRL